MEKYQKHKFPKYKLEIFKSFKIEGSNCIIVEFKTRRSDEPPKWTNLNPPKVNSNSCLKYKCVITPLKYRAAADQTFLGAK